MATVWYFWTTAASNTSSATYTTSGSGTAITWGAWNDGTTTAATNTSAVWSGWCNFTTGTTFTVRTAPSRELTAEERAAETERLRVAAEAAKARQEEARLAVEKAEALLRAHLDEEQQASLDREQAFLVSVQSGRKYRVRRGQRGNVKELDDKGQEIRSFCIHPDDVPDQDAMLAQKLLLETDEPAFRRIANITELQRRVA